MSDRISGSWNGWNGAPEAPSGSTGRAPTRTPTMSTRSSKSLISAALKHDTKVETPGSAQHLRLKWEKYPGLNVKDAEKLLAAFGGNLEEIAEIMEKRPNLDVDKAVTLKREFQGESLVAIVETLREFPNLKVDEVKPLKDKIKESLRVGSVCLNSIEPFRRWISRSVMPPPGLVATG